MGFNMRIIPRESEMNNFWVMGYSENTMPEEYINRFWEFRDFSFAHLTATLHKMIVWHGKEVILTGIAPEIEPSGKKKTFMIFEIEPGTVYIGYELAKGMNLKKGNIIDIYGTKFIIAKTLAESGSTDDIRIYGTLTEIQELLSMQGRVNEIMALNCLCLSPDGEEYLEIMRDQLAQVLPEAKVIMNTTIATARERQRLMLEKYFSIITIFVIILVALWIGVLVMINVRERNIEIGILNAIGHNWKKIAALFLGKIILIGIIGAFIGFFLGNFLALKFGMEIFKVTADSIEPIYGLLWKSLLGATLFSVLAAMLPTIIAVLKDPAKTLTNE